MTGSTTFFGRDGELAELQRAANTHRVVTVCGPAGVGKTALLQAWMRGDGLFVDLTELREDVPLATFIAASLGGSLSADADELARRRALRSRLASEGDELVLDNAEHVASAVAELVTDELFADCRFVVATRERLRCADEHLLQLDPFGTDGDDPEAGRYLRWRAEQLGSTHALRDDELNAVRELVRRLDGLPLAMDLAAGRLNLLRPAKLLERLEQSADVLSGEQTRSLTDALLASWEAADDEERAALTSLAVLNGPFDPALGEAVIGADGLELLQRLRDRSVIVVDLDGRIRLLLSVRDFVRARTDEASRRGAIRRLSRALAELVPAWLHAAARLSPLDRVTQLRDHTAHLRLAVEANQATDEDLLVCALALAETALLDGTAPQAYELLGTVRLDDARLRVARARLATENSWLHDAEKLLVGIESLDALIERAQNAQLQGDLDLARALAAQASELASEDIERGRAAVALAGAMYHSGEYDDAKAQYDLALRYARRAVDRRTEGRALQNLAILHCDQMRLDLARNCMDQAIERHREVGDTLREAWAHNGMGVIALRAGDAADGLEALGHAAELFDRVGQRVGAATAQANLAMIAMDSGRYDDGAQHALDALARVSSEEDPYIVGMSKLCLALCTWFRGDRDAAGRHFAKFEPSIDRDAHVQLALSWDAGYGAFLSASGDKRADEILARGEALVADDEGHQIYRTMFELARSQQHLYALRHGDDRDAALLSLFDAVTGADPQRSEPLRFTIALLAHEAPEDLAETLQTVANATQDTLLVSREAEAIRPPNGAWEVLGKSPSLWRLFLALAEGARDGDAPLDLDALQEATWPGEVLTVESATNRLHVSLSKLRKAGLKAFLVRDGNGYRLDCAVEFV